MVDNERRTGRTTRQIERCLDLLAKGESSIFVSRLHVASDVHMRMAFEMAAHLSPNAYLNKLTRAVFRAYEPGRIYFYGVEMFDGKQRKGSFRGMRFARVEFDHDVQQGRVSFEPYGGMV